MSVRGDRVVAATAVVVLLVGVGLALRSAPSVRSGAEAPATAAPGAAPSSDTAPSPAPVPPRTTGAARPHASGPLPAAPPLSGCPAPVLPPGRPRPPLPPLVAESALPAPLAVQTKASSLTAVRGKGLWVTPFARTAVDVPQLVALGRRLGVRALWVRTGGTRQGFYGDRFLPQLLAAAHHAGLAVVAWDFPTLSDPVADALRAHQALAAGVDAFSPDIETRAEGSFPTARRIALYLSLVRHTAGTRPVVATVPRPTPIRLRTFPYHAFTPYADVFAPMVYWSCSEPGALVQQSLSRLGRLLPVAPVGQAYDMGPEGGRVGLPSRAETLRFLDAARRGGAIGASLWTVEQAGRAQLAALAAYAWRVS